MSTDQIGGSSGEPPTADTTGSAATPPPAGESVTSPATAPPATAPADGTDIGAAPGGAVSDGAAQAGAAPDGAAQSDAGPAGAPPAGPPGGPAGFPPPDGPAEQPKKRHPVVRIAVSVISALVVFALISGGKSLLRSWVDKDHIDNVAAGDCLRESPSDRNSPYRIVGCDDSAATHKTLEVVANGTEGSCIHVAGATRSITNGTGNVCLGPKDVDPAKAVNVAKEGDCLAQNGDEAERVDCSGGNAEYTVLKRLDDVLEAEAEKACDEVPGTVGTYSWDWQSDLTGDLTPLAIDVLLCLGQK